MNAESTALSRSALRQSAVGQDGFRSEALSMREIAAHAMVRLQRLPGEVTTDGGKGALPEHPGHCAGNDPAVLCLRPGEWLVVSESMSPGELLSRTQSQWSSETCFAFDESDGLAMMNVEGKAATWLLRKHCSVDFTTLNEGETGCLQTRMGRISVLMHYCVNGLTGRYRLIVDRSLVRYLWELLASGVPHALELLNQYEARDPGLP